MSLFLSRKVRRVAMTFMGKFLVQGRDAVGEKLPEVRAASLLSEMGTVLALPPGWLGQAAGD